MSQNQQIQPSGDGHSGFSFLDKAISNEKDADRYENGFMAMLFLAL